MKVDIVVPYVDMSDPEWLKLAEENNIPISKNRFRGQGEFFRYFFRGIDKNLSWINNMFLLVQSESQVPYWLDKSKIKIVLHEQFIPKEFLPLYSSCAIEMFIPNIPELSEHFLYFNDDIYLFNHLDIEKFFIEDKVCQHFIKNSNENYLCGKINANSFRTIYNKNLEFKPDHHIKPLLLSKCKECFELYKEEIFSSITKTREITNMNVYLYSYYLEKQGLCLESKIKFKMIFRWDLSAFIVPKDIICINDNLKNNVYEDEKLNNKFKKLFPNKSKYEL